jgi:MFS family permease
MMENRLGADSSRIGLMMSLMSITTAVMSSQLARLNRLLGQKRQLIIGSAFYMLASLLMLGANSYLALGVAVIVFGFGHGITIPSIQNMLVGYAAINERAAFMSLNSMVLRGGQTFGPLLVGVFYALGGLEASFLSGAVMALLMMIIIFATVHIHKKPDE